MSDRPRIGITTGLEDGRKILDPRYPQAVESAGGLPIIAPLFESRGSAAAFASLLDALIITGGPGITRGLIGVLPADLAAVDARRDRSDELIYAAMADRPFLGICYGMQFANAMAGGAIYADAQAQTAAAVHSAEQGATGHEVMFDSGGRLSALLGSDRLTTNSHHIQAIATLGAGLRATAKSADGVIEGIESADGLILGVQFHPERMLDRALPLFEDLVERAAAVRSSR